MVNCGVSVLEREEELEGDAAGVLEPLSRGVCDSEAMGEKDGMLGSALPVPAKVALSCDGEDV